jgi:hypothetical protein
MGVRVKAATVAALKRLCERKSVVVIRRCTDGDTAVVVMVPLVG